MTAGFGRLIVAAVVGAAAWAVLAGDGVAADRDLHSGLAYLRAGAQLQAERDLTRYRDEEPNPEVRTKIDRVLPLLRRPLTDEVREYVAVTIEEAVFPRSGALVEGRRPSFWSRMFPVFP